MILILIVFLVFKKRHLQPWQLEHNKIYSVNIKSILRQKNRTMNVVVVET